MRMSLFGALLRQRVWLGGIALVVVAVGCVVLARSPLAAANTAPPRVE